MENKINIAKILKNCPSGMELYSPLVGDCKFVKVHDYESKIIVELETGATVVFQTDGRYFDCPNAECILFPKGKTTWEGFKRPFKDGDILISGLEDCCNPFIFKQTNGFGNAQCYCAINVFEKLILNSDNWTPIKGCRLATEEEKQKLFDAIKANGYRWNAKTKTLEKLPKFKVGDIIKSAYKEDYRYIITHVTDTHYTIKEVEEGFLYHEPICEEKNWELVSSKFDITTLKPFDKVLMRSSDSMKWTATFYSHKENEYFAGCGLYCQQCIPYEGNEHLRGTDNDCNDFYKTW